MSDLNFAEAAGTEHIEDVAEPLGLPDFSDLEAEYEGAGQAEPEPRDWSEQRAETVPEDVLNELQGGVLMGVSFAMDMACGIANRKPFGMTEKAQTASRVMNVLKFYPNILDKTGTPKSRAWAALGLDVGMKAIAKKAEPPETIYPDGTEAAPPEHAPQHSGAFNTGGQQFGGQGNE